MLSFQIRVLLITGTHDLFDWNIQQGVGFTRSTDETSNDGGGKGWTYKPLSESISFLEEVQNVIGESSNKRAKAICGYLASFVKIV